MIDPQEDVKPVPKRRELRNIFERAILQFCLNDPKSENEIAVHLGRDPGHTRRHYIKPLVDHGRLTVVYSHSSRKRFYKTNPEQEKWLHENPETVTLANVESVGSHPRLFSENDLGQALTSDNKPVDAGQALTSDNKPVDAGQALTSANKPVDAGQALTSANKPNVDPWRKIDEKLDRVLEGLPEWPIGDH